jgi:YidC/Oxa1 family membrane protein insertase
MFFVTANIFQPLIDVFEAILKAIHSVVGGSWGWSIVLLTVLVRAVLLPLTLKQFHSMQRMQALQPELKAIQNKYKDDKQRQQQEVMKFYKENQVNPLASCLPLVAQLPVFISLFYMLRSSLRIDICPQTQLKYQLAHHIITQGSSVSHAHTVACGPDNGANFLFIPDLTGKASGAVLIVLILLYVGTQLGSSLLMSSSQMDKTQRQIMLVLPLFFVIFIINFPAGVIVYWITTNLWTIVQQWVVKRRLGPVGAPAVAAVGATDGQARGGGGSGGGRGPGGGPNGSDSGEGGGLGALLRGRTKEKEKEPAAAGARVKPRTAPPPPPRKKKKRSGRRR